MSALRNSGLPVPEVIAVSPHTAITKTTKPSPPWLLLESAEGRPLGSHGLGEQASQELARFLSAMHLCPTNGFGPLHQESMSILGMKDDMKKGLIARWNSGQFWPYDGSDLSLHPLTMADRTFLRNVEDLIIRGVTETGDEPNALLHSDLHREHIFTKGSQLTAVIDFGGAFVGPPSWEFAPIGLFLGWSTADTVMMSYAQVSSRDMSIVAAATATTALIFGLYRYDAESRAGRLRSEGPKIVNFLREAAKRARSAR